MKIAYRLAKIVLSVTIFGSALNCNAKVASHLATDNYGGVFLWETQQYVTSARLDTPLEQILTDVRNIASKTKILQPNQSLAGVINSLVSTGAISRHDLFEGQSVALDILKGSQSTVTLQSFFVYSQAQSQSASLTAYVVVGTIVLAILAVHKGIPYLREEASKIESFMNRCGQKVNDKNLSDDDYYKECGDFQ